MLEPQHLRTFQEIARTGSYSAAARNLGYTQPALSYQMRALERTIGTPLTARAGRSVRLTAAGHTLLRHADQILTAIRVAERDLAHVVGSSAGVLRIATFASAGATLVPNALADVTAAHPAVDVRVMNADPSEAREMVTRGDADLALTYRYDIEDIQSAHAAGSSTGTSRRSPLVTIPLLVDHVHLVLPRRHPLATTPVTGLWPLADETWLMGAPLFSDLLQRLAARAGFAARITPVADDFVAMQALVARGVGITLLPGLALIAYQRDDVVAIPFPSWPERRVDVESWPDLLRVPSVTAMADALVASAAAAVRRAPAPGLLSLPLGGSSRPLTGTPDPADGDSDSEWEPWFEAAQRTLPRAAAERPERSVLISDETGAFQVHTWQRGASTVPALTSRPGGVMLADISVDGEQVWWFADDNGDEVGVWMIQDFSGGGARVASSDVPPGSPGGLAVGSRRAVVARTDGTGAQVYVVEVGRGPGAPGGAARLIYSHPEFAAVGAISPSDDLVAISHSEHGDAQKPAVRVFRLDGAGAATPIVDLWDGHGFGLWPQAFSPVSGSTELLVLQERGGRSLPLIWDVVTGEQNEIDPQLAGETAAWWYPDGSALLILHQHRARSELYRIDLGTGNSARLPTRRGYISDACPQPDGSVDYLWSCAQEPPRVLNTASDDPVIPPSVTAPRGPVLDDMTVAGSAGDIHVLIARPPGLENGPQPTVFMVHGGPAAHDADSFSPTRNAWTSVGYTVVHVNYRGSTGYGAEWRNANIGRPGQAELEDVVAVRDALVANGTSDPDHVVICGESWGGGLALLALGLYPAMWTLGVALVPVADTAAVYDDMMEEIRAAYRVRFGGTPTDVPDVYAASSALSVVGDVSVPVLITGGLRDPRCPIRQIELYVSRLVELGKQHEVHFFDRGHESRTRAGRVDEMSRVLSFTRRHMPPPDG